ncbi:MAG: four helix bundle protein [Thermoanaerobaculia bacterium]
MQRFQDLRVWQAARQLSVGVYRATKTLPADERFGLTAQLRRAAVSILANIAEGAKRTHRADYVHFLNIAEASLAELQCLLILCEDLGYMSRVQQELRQESARTAVMLDALRRAVLKASGTSRT